jgi:hypothetical protein
MMIKKALQLILIVCFYIAFLIATNIIHNLYFHVNVVLFSALLDVVFSLIIVLGILSIFRWFRTFTGFEILSVAIILLLTGYVYAISLPTLIDRSLSIYLLEKINQKNGVELNLVDQLIAKEYVKDHQLAKVRITEQLESGTIVIKNGCVLLTPKGEFIVKIASYIQKNLLPKKRLLMGEYNDSLTDPLARKSSTEEFSCPK